MELQHCSEHLKQQYGVACSEARFIQLLPFPVSKSKLGFVFPDSERPEQSITAGSSEAADRHFSAGEAFHAVVWDSQRVRRSSEKQLIDKACLKLDVSLKCTLLILCLPGFKIKVLCLI